MLMMKSNFLHVSHGNIAPFEASSHRIDVQLWERQAAVTMICYTNKSEDPVSSCRLEFTHANIILPRAFPLHGPLGFVVAKGSNKLRIDWNWKTSNGDSSGVLPQYGDDEIWFFEVRCIIRCWAAVPSVARTQRRAFYSLLQAFTAISHSRQKKINAIFTSTITIILPLLIPT